MSDITKSASSIVPLAGQLSDFSLPVRTSVALSRIESRSQELLSRLDQVAPNHSFGYPKLKEMRDFLDEAPQIAELHNLTEHEEQLLKIILRGHDLGRHVEAFGGHDLCRSTQRHGFLSVDLLNNWGVLEFFRPLDRTIISQAIAWHAERVVPQDINPCAYKLCYILRDHDKIEILRRAEELFDPKRLVSDLFDLYFPARIAQGQQALALLVSAPEAHAICSGAIDSFFGAGFVVDHPLADTVHKILGGPIHPELIKSLSRKESGDLQYISHSFASQILCQAMIVFDLRHSHARSVVQTEQLLSPFLDRLALLLPEESQQFLLESFAEFR